MANEHKTTLQHYIEIAQKVARVEHRRIPSHMVEYEELLSIGIIAIQVMIKNKTPGDGGQPLHDGGPDGAPGPGGPEDGGGRPAGRGGPRPQHLR